MISPHGTDLILQLIIDLGIYINMIFLVSVVSMT
jgi:hypothetical protein